MTDMEFLSRFVTERMQMHYSRRGGSTAETDDLLRMESEYAQALGALPDGTRATIEAYVKSSNFPHLKPSG